VVVVEPDRCSVLLESSGRARTWATVHNLPASGFLSVARQKYTMSALVIVGVDGVLPSTYQVNWYSPRSKINCGKGRDCASKRMPGNYNLVIRIKEPRSNDSLNNVWSCLLPGLPKPSMRGTIRANMADVHEDQIKVRLNLLERFGSLKADHGKLICAVRCYEAGHIRSRGTAKGKYACRRIRVFLVARTS
jgi:hypothetical protein